MDLNEQQDRILVTEPVVALFLVKKPKFTIFLGVQKNFPILLSKKKEIFEDWGRRVSHPRHSLPGRATTAFEIFSNKFFMSRKHDLLSKRKKLKMISV
jgi:hypothetical protein